MDCFLTLLKVSFHPSHFNSVFQVGFLIGHINEVAFDILLINQFLLTKFFLPRVWKNWMSLKWIFGFQDQKCTQRCLKQKQKKKERNQKATLILSQVKYSLHLFLCNRIWSWEAGLFEICNIQFKIHWIFRNKELEGITGTIWFNPLILQEIEAQRDEMKYLGLRSSFFAPKDSDFWRDGFSPSFSQGNETLTIWLGHT